MEKVRNKNVGKGASCNVETYRAVAITAEDFVSKTIAATFPSVIIGCRDVAVAAHESTPELDSENLIRIED